jgi:hypothetical protein
MGKGAPITSGWVGPMGKGATITFLFVVRIEKNLGGIKIVRYLVELVDKGVLINSPTFDLRAVFKS